MATFFVFDSITRLLWHAMNNLPKFIPASEVLNPARVTHFEQKSVLEKTAKTEPFDLTLNFTLAVAGTGKLPNRFTGGKLVLFPYLTTNPTMTMSARKNMKVKIAVSSAILRGIFGEG
jgi:hypothetical protein